MSWSLKVNGETLAHDVEQELVAELRRVLSNPVFKGVESFFRGNHLATNVHTAAPKPEAQPEAPVAPVTEAPKATKGAASTRTAKTTTPKQE